MLGPARSAYQQRLDELTKLLASREEQARAALTAQQFSLAREHIEAIQAADPQGSWGDSLMAAYRGAYGASLKTQLHFLLDAGDISGARDVMKTIRGLGLPEAEVAEAQGLFEERELRWLRDTTRTRIHQRRFYTAYLEILRSGRQRELEAPGGRSDIKGRPKPRYRAKRGLASGNPTRAYLEAVKGLELASHDTGMFDVHRSARALLEQVQPYIAIPALRAAR